MTYVESAQQGDNGFFGRWQEDQQKKIKKVEKSAPGIVVDMYNERSSRVLLRSRDALSLKSGQGEKFYRRRRTGSQGTGGKELVDLKTRESVQWRIQGRGPGSRPLLNFRPN